MLPNLCNRESFQRSLKGLRVLRHLTFRCKFASPPYFHTDPLRGLHEILTDISDENNCPLEHVEIVITFRAFPHFTTKAHWSKLDKILVGRGFPNLHCLSLDAETSDDDDLKEKENRKIYCRALRDFPRAFPRVTASEKILCSFDVPIAKFRCGVLGCNFCFGPR